VWRSADLNVFKILALHELINLIWNNPVQCCGTTYVRSTEFSKRPSLLGVGKPAEIGRTFSYVRYTYQIALEDLCLK
jgi:hypothetical protein